MKPYSEFIFADLVVEYLLDAETGQIGWRLVPRDRRGKVAAKDGHVDPLVHVQVRGEDRAGGFLPGRTMRGGSPSLKFDAQNVEEDVQCVVVRTRLVSERGYTCEHVLSWTREEPAIEVWSVFENRSEGQLTLEMITSFSLGGTTMFDTADAPERLFVHRFRSVWSAEGRHERTPIEQFHLEQAWQGQMLFSERFGQVGSMPVRGFFPFVAVEDAKENVLWGVQLAWAGSWQMEVSRRYGDACLSGGLADREFGHWWKEIAPGEHFETPRAVLATACGDIDDLCARLTSIQNRAAAQQPAFDREMPIICNEWCTTWGDPRHDKIAAIAGKLRAHSRARVLVIDAGWFKKRDGGNWSSDHGDWIPNVDLFPTGLEAAAQSIRDCGLMPGLWFEMETCGRSSTAFSLTDRLLKLDGVPITAGERRFWDLRDPWVVEYLTERVIGTLRKGGFGYLKVDYNEPLGIGCDGAESPGEGLRQQIDGVYSFFRKIRTELPELIIENCSSGGHRLEPSMMALTAQASFSDAHETVEIPIIGANLHRLILPRQSQIWAVLKAQDNDRRLAYSLAATFLGRMCLSGELTELSEAQWAIVQRAEAFFEEARAIIGDGFSRRIGPELLSWRHPRQWQAILRTSADGKRALAVVHSFAQPFPANVEINLPRGASWKIERTFHVQQSEPEVDRDSLTCPLEAEFSACAVLLRAD